MIKDNKSVIALGLAVILIFSILTGCKIKSDTPILGRIMGLGSNEVFEIEDLSCTKAEYKLVFMDYANKYRKAFGDNVDWDGKVDEGMTLKQFVMNKVKEDISVRYTLSKMAESNNVKIDKEDMSEIVDASRKYYDGLNDEEKEYTGASLDDVQAVYCNYVLADKVYEKITEDIGCDISEEDARVIKIQYIKMDNSSKSKQTLDKVIKIVKKKNGDFAQQAKQYTMDTSVDKIIKKNEASGKFELEAFQLNSNEISKVILDGENSYLIYCIDSYDKAATAANKEKIIKEAKDKYFQEKYREYIKDIDSDFNTRVWEDIEIPEGKVKAGNLLDLYEEIE